MTDAEKLARVWYEPKEIRDGGALERRLAAHPTPLVEQRDELQASLDESRDFGNCAMQLRDEAVALLRQPVCAEWERARGLLLARLGLSYDLSDTPKPAAPPVQPDAETIDLLRRMVGYVDTDKKAFIHYDLLLLIEEARKLLAPPEPEWVPSSDWYKTQQAALESVRRKGGMERAGVASRLDAVEAKLRAGDAAVAELARLRGEESK